MNVFYLLPDNIKDSKYIEIHVMDANISCKFIFQDNQRRIKRIIYDNICGSMYTRTYRHSESKVLKVSDEPPDN